MFDEDMYEQLEGEPRNTPTPDPLAELFAEVLEIKAMLAPIAPFIEMLPELAEKIGPALEGLKDNPVLKMIGLKL